MDWQEAEFSAITSEDSAEGGGAAPTGRTSSSVAALIVRNHEDLEDVMSNVSSASAAGEAMLEFKKQELLFRQKELEFNVAKLKIEEAEKQEDRDHQLGLAKLQVANGSKHLKQHLADSKEIDPKKLAIVADVWVSHRVSHKDKTHPAVQREADQDTVTQTPSALAVPRGTLVTLHCQLHLRSRGKIQAVVFSWSTATRNFTCLAPSQPEAATVEYKEDPKPDLDQRVTLEVDASLQSAELKLQSAQTEDSGIYICSVSILQPLPRKDLVGNGTVLNVTEPLKPPGGLPFFHTYTVAAVFSLILLLALFVLLVMKTKGCHRAGGEADTLSTGTQIVRSATIYADIQCSPQVPRGSGAAMVTPALQERPIIYSELNLSAPGDTEQLHLTRD
ncbi:uncharacterized protein [Ambystoma mexicanum]|uniref:uncharacterized protein n=1 Tax=Ambystoma mexicanum TaxID=8296 RepID=UPI0037E8EF7B